MRSNWFRLPALVTLACLVFAVSAGRDYVARDGGSALGASILLASAFFLPLGAHFRLARTWAQSWWLAALATVLFHLWWVAAFALAGFESPRVGAVIFAAFLWVAALAGLLPLLGLTRPGGEEGAAPARAKAPAQADERAQADDPALIGTYGQMMTLAPAMQAPTYRNMAGLYATRVIKAGGRPRPLPLGEPLEPVITVDGQACPVDVFMARNRCAGLLVLVKGEIALERYALGNTARTRWLSFSVAKSISSTLVGAAVQDGRIASLDDPVNRYVKALTGTAYDGVTVRQILQMRSGVRWNEDYLDPASDRRRLLAIQMAQERGGVLRYLASLPRVAEAGTVFNYSTGETCLLGEILAGAIGQPVSDYLAARIWTPYGMETDAYWQLDAPGGLEITGSGLNATLRDFGRFGLFVLGGGVIDQASAAPTAVLPPGWMAEATSTDPASLTAPGRIPGFEPMGYGYQWWTLPPSATGPATPGRHHYAALGVFGQQIHVLPAEGLVVALHSAWPRPLEGPSLAETLALLTDICQTLAQRRSTVGSAGR